MTPRALYYAVHGRRPARRQSTQPSARRLIGPARSPKYRSWIRTLPCACCGTTVGVEAAHTGDDGGMAQKASDYSCVPLCFDCHQGAPGAYHRVGRNEFERRNGLDLAGLVKRLNHDWFAYSRMVK